MKIKFLTIVAIAAVAFLAACGKSDADLKQLSKANWLLTALPV